MYFDGFRYSIRSKQIELLLKASLYSLVFKKFGTGSGHMCSLLYLPKAVLNTSAPAPKLDIEYFKCLEFIYYYYYLDECLATEETTEFLL
jgi:hypothetical protein